MAIKDFVLPTSEVQLPGGGSFAVRGLSLEDITILVSMHGPVMEEFFKKYSNSGQADTMQVGMSMLSQAPVLVAQLIAIAADASDQVELVRKMPLVVQQDALEKIAKMTFDASGGPGKFFEAVIRLIQSTTNAMTGLTRSTTGSLESGVK